MCTDVSLSLINQSHTHGLSCERLTGFLLYPLKGSKAKPAKRQRHGDPGASEESSMKTESDSGQRQNNEEPKEDETQGSKREEK